METEDLLALADEWDDEADAYDGERHTEDAGRRHALRDCANQLRACVTVKA